MKIPERFNESSRSQNFRQTQPMHIAYKLIDLDDPEWKKLYESVVIEVRVFWPNNSQTCKAVIWIKDKKGHRYGWGVGVTSGTGYHHESVAIEDAFSDMGIKFDTQEAFGTSGTGAQEKAIVKIGEALGYNNTVLVDFNP